MKKAIPIILVIILAIILLVVKRCQHTNANTGSGNVTTGKGKKPADNINRDKGFDRRISYIQYSNHARCRMDCRHFTQAEVQDIMQGGKINYNKSDLQNARCPRYALEGDTKDNQHVRIVFAQCNEKTEVVTVIDLDTEWECHCPGDDAQYKNRN